MMRTIIYWLRPNTEVHQETTLLRFRRALHKAMLRMLVFFYKRYAFSDTIIIDGANIKMIHEYRDWEFEKMLRAIGIETRPQMETGRKMTFNILKRKGYKFFLHTFRFEDSIQLFMSGKEVSIKRDSNYLADTDMYCKLRVSSEKDVISRSSLECYSEQEDSKTAVKYEEVTNQDDNNIQQNTGVEIDESF